MKKFIAIKMILIFSFCMLNAEEEERFMDYYKKAEELAWLGLAYCMGIDDKSEIEKELYNLSFDPTKDKVKIMDSKLAFDELKAYIDEEKEFYKISDEIARLNYKDFKGCIKMFYYGTGYGSGYHFEVERIVKKYCKECK